jgi:hypothetical protein
MQRSRSGITVSLWMSEDDDRVLTTGELREGGARDEVLLFVAGELATCFEVTAGLGAKLLGECGLLRVS